MVFVWGEYVIAMQDIMVKIVAKQYVLQPLIMYHPLTAVVQVV
jgi:hypothetical protein